MANLIQNHYYLKDNLSYHPSYDINEELIDGGLDLVNLYLLLKVRKLLEKTLSVIY